MSRALQGGWKGDWAELGHQQPVDPPDDLQELIARKQAPYPADERRAWIEARLREWARRAR